MTRVELIGAEYRVGAAYRFVQVDRLPEAQRVALGDFVRGPDVYAVLVPVRARAQTVKAIDHSTALLYLTLREPGRLPSSMQTALGDELPAVVARLVLDGVLEIRCGEDFVSGPDAASLLGVNIEPGTPRGRLAQLSHQALRYGQHLDIDDVQTLAGRLYAFNRSAVTSAWSRRLATREATARHLGLANDGSIGSHALGWVPQHGLTESSWLSWRSSARMHPDRDNAVYNRSLSPHVGGRRESSDHGRGRA